MLPLKNINFKANENLIEYIGEEVDAKFISASNKKRNI